MDNLTLDINSISARGLKHVNIITKMDVYAVVSITGGQTKSQQKTPVDGENNTNPSWNFPMTFTMDATAANQNRLNLVFNLRCQRTLGDKDVGVVNVPIKDLIHGSGPGQPAKYLRYQVIKPSGRPKGELNFSYRYVRKVPGKLTPAPAPLRSDDPVPPCPAPSTGRVSMYPPPYVMTSAADAYPQYVTSSGYGYPTLQPQPGYRYPPQTEYGYPPQPGYGYAPVQRVIWG